MSIILASAAVIGALTPMLRAAMARLSRKSVLVSERILVPVENSSGQVVRDAEGEPIMHWIDRPRFVETRPEPQVDVAYGIEGPIGIRVEYSETAGQSS